MQSKHVFKVKDVNVLLKIILEQILPAGDGVLDGGGGEGESEHGDEAAVGRRRRRR